jgi:hypothetical protein
MWIAQRFKTRRVFADALHDRRPLDVPTVVESTSIDDRQERYVVDFWAVYAVVISLEVALRGEKCDWRDSFFGALKEDTTQITSSYCALDDLDSKSVIMYQVCLSSSYIVIVERRLSCSSEPLTTFVADTRLSKKSSLQITEKQTISYSGHKKYNDSSQKALPSGIVHVFQKETYLKLLGQALQLLYAVYARQKFTLLAHIKRPFFLSKNCYTKPSFLFSKNCVN